MYTSTFLSQKKLTRGTCVASTKVCAPLRQLFELHRTRPPSLPPHSLTRTYTSRPMTPMTQSTPTKWFPHLSSRGHRYQMILYHTDSNSIWVEPTKNRTEGELILARTRALSRMRSCGLSPGCQVLDNKASTAYKQAILDSGMTYQLMPPDDHRRNVAKRPCKHGKTILLLSLAAQPTNFHSTFGANSFHTWNDNSTSCISPMPTPGSLHMPTSTDLTTTMHHPSFHSALMHDKPHQRKTYAQHCSKGWVIGTSTEHYRCWKIWSPTTRSTRSAATEFFKHKYLTNLFMSPADALIAAAANLTHVIKHNAKAQHIGAKNLQDLQHLQQLFSDTAKQQLLSPMPTKPVAPHAPPPRVQAHTLFPTACTPPPTSAVVSDDEDSDNKMAPLPRVPTRRPVPFTPCPQPTTTPPALNTRSRTCSLTHKTMLHVLATRHIGITAAQATHGITQPTCSTQSSMTRLVS
eukprot:CCRYP_003830-RB/>CCRYP_003830-RB protein AED:0.42 eAED:0.41 QI:0/0/0/1/0/0/3/0/461